MTERIGNWDSLRRPCFLFLRCVPRNSSRASLGRCHRLAREENVVCHSSRGLVLPLALAQQRIQEQVCLRRVPLPAFVVSLESIFLSLFILISQNRSNLQADQRNHLDLQINLLSEEENTKMLQMLQAICEHHKLAIGKDPETARRWRNELKSATYCPSCRSTCLPRNRRLR